MCEIENFKPRVLAKKRNNNKKSFHHPRRLKSGVPPGASVLQHCVRCSDCMGLPGKLVSSGLDSNKNEMPEPMSFKVGLRLSRSRLLG